MVVTINEIGSQILEMSWKNPRIFLFIAVELNSNSNIFLNFLLTF